MKIIESSSVLRKIIKDGMKDFAKIIIEGNITIKEGEKDVIHTPKIEMVLIKEKVMMLMPVMQAIDNPKVTVRNHRLKQEKSILSFKTRIKKIDIIYNKKSRIRVISEKQTKIQLI